MDVTMIAVGTYFFVSGYQGFNELQLPYFLVIRGTLGILAVTIPFLSKDCKNYGANKIKIIKDCLSLDLFYWRHNWHLGYHSCP